MSSYNMTCGVSQLPIYPGDDIALFILTRSDESAIKRMHDWMFHADALFIPLAPAIFTQLDRFESFKFATTSIPTPILEKQIAFEISTKGSTGIGSSSNNKIIKNGLKELELGVKSGIEGIIEKIVNAKIENITYMAIHKEIYEQMIDISAKSAPFYNNKLANKEEDLYENITNWLNETKIGIETGNVINDTVIMLNKQSLIRLLDKNYNEFLTNGKLMNDFINLLLVNYTMEISRKMWIPQTGRNSQFENYELTQYIGTFATKRYIHKLEDLIY